MRHTKEGQRLIEERVFAEVHADAEHEIYLRNLAVARTKAQKSIAKLINQIAKARMKNKRKKSDYLSELLFLAKAGYKALYENETR